MSAVIKQPAVPEVVVSSPTSMEILVVSSVKAIQTIQDVLASVRVDDVKENAQSHSMGSVNQFF